MAELRRIAGNNVDTYIVGYKKYETVNDKKFGSSNFESGHLEVDIKSTNRSNAGMAQRRFLSSLSASEKKRTVVTGAMIR